MTTGFIKPDGLPTFKTGHALASGMLFYPVDLGDGTIVDVAAGTTMYPAVVPSSTLGTFGRGIHWPGTHESNLGYYCDTPAAVKTAAGLSARGSGAGFTFGCTCVLLADISGQAGWIFGQPANAFEQQPYANWGFVQEIGSGKEIHCVGNNGTILQILGTFTGPTYESTLTRLVCTVLNTSAGVSTAKFFANGNLIDTQTGITFAQVTSLEDEIQLGTIYHTGTGINKDCINGYALTGWAKDGAWSDAQCEAWMDNPIDMLQWGSTAPQHKLEPNRYETRML